MKWFIVAMLAASLAACSTTPTNQSLQIELIVPAELLEPPAKLKQL